MPEEKFNEIQGIVRQDDFSLEPKSQIKLFLSNLVRWAFSALFARYGNKLVALKCDQYGGLNINPRPGWASATGGYANCADGVQENICVGMGTTWKRAVIWGIDSDFHVYVTCVGMAGPVAMADGQAPIIIEGPISDIKAAGDGAAADVSAWVLTRETGA